MFIFKDEEIRDISRNNDLEQFITDMVNKGAMSAEEKSFIDGYLKGNPYDSKMPETQRFAFISELNTVLINRVKQFRVVGDVGSRKTNSLRIIKERRVDNG